MASIRLDNVTKRFGSVAAVSAINIDVADGEFLVLLGPSGCGKSTLLRMLAGLETISDGEIHLDGRRVDHLPPASRDMAFVFQSYALYPHMTVRRNIAFPLIMRQFRWWFHIPVLGGIAKRRIERSPGVGNVVERTADILALRPMLDRYPRTLSGGQRQRVALGRAMVRKPQVFLMDEPLSNLDAKLRTTMRTELVKLHQDVGGTFVYVTHDQIEAMTMGTKVALLRDGALQQFGSPRDIYTSPANTYVARFVGTPPMNLIAARAAGDSLQIAATNLALSPRLAAIARANAQADLLLGVRPTMVRIQPEPFAGALTGTIAVVEHIGAESLITITLRDAVTFHGDDGERTDHIVAAVPGYSELRPGTVVSLALDLSDAVLFAATTGAALAP